VLPHPIARHVLPDELGAVPARDGGEPGPLQEGHLGGGVARGAGTDETGLEQDDAGTGAGEQERCRHAGEPAPDDGHVVAAGDRLARVPGRPWHGVRAGREPQRGHRGSPSVLEPPTAASSSPWVVRTAAATTSGRLPVRSSSRRCRSAPLPVRASRSRPAATRPTPPYSSRAGRTRSTRSVNTSDAGRGRPVSGWTRPSPRP